MMSTTVSSETSQRRRRRAQEEDRGPRRSSSGSSASGTWVLPLAMAFAEKRLSVVGFDVDPEKIEALRAGRSYIQHLAGVSR